MKPAELEKLVKPAGFSIHRSLTFFFKTIKVARRHDGETENDEWNRGWHQVGRRRKTKTTTIDSQWKPGIETVRVREEEERRKKRKEEECDG